MIPLAGAPSAAWLAGRLVAAEASLPVRTVAELELGLAIDGVVFDDPWRNADSAASAQAGFARFADYRRRPLQADLRLGWSPAALPDHAASGVVADVGWRWQTR